MNGGQTRVDFQRTAGCRAHLPLKLVSSVVRRIYIAFRLDIPEPSSDLGIVSQDLV
jgi:hypothetical protein